MITSGCVCGCVFVCVKVSAWVGTNLGCFACVDSILFIVLVKIYIFSIALCLHSAYILPYKTIGFVYLSCLSVLILAVVVVVVVFACTCLSECVCVCVLVSSQHCCWLFGLSCFSIDILWKNLSCPELLFPSFLCLPYVCVLLLLLLLLLYVYLFVYIWVRRCENNWFRLATLRWMFCFVVYSCVCWKKNLTLIGTKLKRRRGLRYDFSLAVYEEESWIPRVCLLIILLCFERLSKVDLL